MAENLGELKFSIDVDTRGFSSSLDQARNKAVGFGDSMTGVLGKVAAVAAGLWGLSSAVSVVTREVDGELIAIAKLNAVLASTKMAAGLTVDQLQRMASGLQAVTTYEDEAIMSAQALLLTFTRIGSDIFPRALKAVLDVSAALGQDLKSSAIQVGKALQDPMWGITALRRVGVNFTHAQQEMIKGWVQHGEVLRAQQFILAELEREFGGVSEAMRGTLSGALQALRNDVGDLIQAMIGMGGAGEAIYDVSVSLSAGFQTLAQSISASHRAASDFSSSLSGLSGVLKGLISLIGGFYVGLTLIYEILVALVKTVVDLTEMLTRLFAVFWETIVERKLGLTDPFRMFKELKRGLGDLAENFVTMHKNISESYDKVVQFGVTALETFSKVSKETNVSAASLGKVKREIIDIADGFEEASRRIRRSQIDVWDEIKKEFDLTYRNWKFMEEQRESLESYWSHVESGWAGIVGSISSSIANVVRDTKVKFTDLITSIVKNLAYAIMEALVFAAIMKAILSALGLPMGGLSLREIFLWRMGFPFGGVGRTPSSRVVHREGQQVIRVAPTYQLMIDSRVVAGAVIVETARRRRYGL